MRKFFRSTFSSFSSAPTDSPLQANVVDATFEEIFDVPSELVSRVHDFEPTIEHEPALTLDQPELDVIVQFSGFMTEPVMEVVVLREPGPVVRLMKRGPRTYSICPHCEASWSLRDRLFEPRTGRPCAIDSIVCPSCTKSVSIPGDVDLRSVK